MKKTPDSIKEITLQGDIPSTVVSLSSRIKNGDEIVKAVNFVKPEIFKDPLVALSAKTVTTSLLDLIQILKSKAGEDISSLGTFIGDAFRKYMEGELNETEASYVILLGNSYLEVYSPGMAKAVGKIKYKGSCRACGFKVPAYPGLYPRHCPNCGTHLNMASIKVESSDKICGVCRKIFNDSFEECEECKQPLLPLSDSFTDVKSALFEVFVLVNSTPKEGEIKYDHEEYLKLLADLKIPLRRKTLVSSIDSDKNTLAEVFRTDILDSYELDESVDKEKLIKFLSSLDEVSLSVLFPFVRSMDKKLFPGMFEGLYSELPERIYEVRRVVEIILSETSLSSPELYKDFVKFLDSVYIGLIPNISNVHESFYYSDLVETKFKDNIAEIREEVKYRKSLHFAIKVLEGDKFNIDTALKTYSSCLTRVVIEYEKSSDPSLKDFKEMVFYNMQKLFTGRYEESVNFLRGVFL